MPRELFLFSGGGNEEFFFIFSLTHTTKNLMQPDFFFKIKSTAASITAFATLRCMLQIDKLVGAFLCCIQVYFLPRMTLITLILRHKGFHGGT